MTDAALLSLGFPAIDHFLVWVIGLRCPSKEARIEFEVEDLTLRASLLIACNLQALVKKLCRKVVDTTLITTH